MAQAIGVDVWGAMEGAPPLSFPESPVDCAIECAKAGFPVESASGGVMGATHPSTLAGCLTTGMAEVLSCLVLVQLVRKGNPVFFVSFDLAQNMRTGGPIFGHPLNSLFNLMWCQVWRARGIPTWAGGHGPSSSKRIDYQCGYEKSMGFLIAALSGAHMISSPGGLTGELSYHPALSIIDDDMIGWVGRILEGVTFNNDTLALDLIEAVGPAGFYLDKEHTRKWWKSEHFFPNVADLQTYADWLEGGKKSTIELAQERMEELLSNYKCKLSEEKQQELDGILEEARKYYKDKDML
jgi:trimethylamine--corrinoid protein Co-methyltransferase